MHLFYQLFSYREHWQKPLGIFEHLEMKSFGAIENRIVYEQGFLSENLPTKCRITLMMKMDHLKKVYQVCLSECYSSIKITFQNMINAKY